MSAVIQAIVASSTSTHVIYNYPSFYTNYSVLSAHPNFASGIWRRDYNTGYFADDPTWFATQTPSYTGANTVVDIGTTLNDTAQDNYSIQWTGYFVPPTTGNYKFRTTSDDGSYMWIGDEALYGFTTVNAAVNNGMAHGPQTVQSTHSYRMNPNKAYPAIYAELSPTFNQIKGYTVSGFYAGAYGA